MKLVKQAFLSVVFVTVIQGGLADGAIIRFNDLAGPHNTPYTGSTEGGFTVTATLGDWRESHLAGDPVPSIYSSSDRGIVEVTKAGGATFKFLQLNMNHAFLSEPGTFQIRGFLDGVQQYLMAGTMPMEFGAVFNQSPEIDIDRLVIRMDRGNASYNLDNIVLDQVPEPAAGMVVLLGFALLGRRRSAAR